MLIARLPALISGKKINAPQGRCVGLGGEVLSPQNNIDQSFFPSSCQPVYCSWQNIKDHEYEDGKRYDAN